MEGFAKTFVDLDFVPIGIYLRWDQQTNKKKIVFKPMWERTTLGTFKDYFNMEDNGIALATGETSDLIAVDCDVPKDNGRSNSIEDGLGAFEDISRNTDSLRTRPSSRVQAEGRTTSSTVLGTAQNYE
ncbi:hypothetical protein BGZ54_007208 [Gamsiella multidivaricata]|nr:hypothetical protein BGZ54_007208 [Gamsiella multidivaricata]